ncbi:helix-turn-helix domain-containing protein [Sphingobacterium sp. SGL-16]|uniref:helix-turn-helix domain-containing protein n=1 Tax=Sphingobacterium sp. SGL-16 TaxID=2710883 RepID=UPI0013E9F24A|nr:helix-turn-helix transcriptional regulator [Sphingobacterium sp. SGL-16]NGM71664.1 helix-turn-helix transcriptional regulator [Sphingobacterium sp. SGL-16]
MEDLFLHVNKPSDIRTQIGEFVKLMRSSKGISQHDLASELNLSRLTIQKIESGKNFNIDTLLLIFQYFDVLNSLSNFISEQEVEFKEIKSFY